MNASQRSKLRKCALVLLMGCASLASVSANAQTTRIAHLANANATLTEEFSDISSLRELRDGRVIVSDRRDNRLGVADFRANAFEAIGRKGEGPNEYPQALRVWPIAGDSSTMIFPRQRWLVFSGSQIVKTMSSTNPAVAAARATIRGTSATGYVLSAGELASDPSVLGDSVVLIRTGIANGTVDTIARLKAVVPKQTSVRSADGYAEFSVPTLRTAEEVVAFVDGSIPVIRLNPYRIDWSGANGVWTLGKPLPLLLLKMNDQEKTAYVGRLAKNVGRPAQSINTIHDWPDFVPPFLSPASVFATPEGRVVVGRLPGVEYPESRYDIVAKSGTLDSQLVLSEREHIVGFGAKSVYTVLVDDDGIQHLRRHNWPAAKSK